MSSVDFTTSVKNWESSPSCEVYGIVVEYKVDYPFGCEAYLFFYSGGRSMEEVNVTKKDSFCNSLEDWKDRNVKIKEGGWIARKSL